MELLYAHIVALAEVFIFVQAQVTLSPDPEGDVQLDLNPLPSISATTINCYKSAPEIKVQYVKPSDNEIVYNIFNGSGTEVVGSTCGSSQSQYLVRIGNLLFINNPVLVGETFKLMITVNSDERRRTYSKQTFTFPAPFNLTGLSVSAVLSSPFTWTCQVTEKYPIIEWYRNIGYIGQMGVVNGNCLTYDINNSYIYNCQQSSLTYTLTILGPDLTEREQGSLWRCKNIDSELEGSKYMKLNIVVPVSNVTITPGSGYTLQADENQTVTFKCETNSNTNPKSTVKWFIGSSDVTTQADSESSTLELILTRNYHQMSVRCSAENSGNTSPINDSTTLDIRFPPASNETLEIMGYTNGLVLYENNSTIISIYCRQPGGNPVVNMTFNCGSKKGTNESTATVAIYRIDLTKDRNLNNQQCECVSTHINSYRHTTNVTFTVYYPPSTPTITISRSFPWKSQTLESLNCTTYPGNPAATIYKWNEGRNVIQTSQMYVINSLQPTDNGRQLSCQVDNNFTLQENVELKSTVTTLNVEYNPVVMIQQNPVEVVEGNTAVLNCTATGNPAPNVSWYRGSTAVTGSTVSSSVHTIVNTSRTMTGNYTCKATASSTGENKLNPDQKDLYLRVFFPPTVTLLIQNTTENTHNHKIRCTAVGDPNNSSVSLQQWIGSVFIRNITDFMMSSPGETVMNIDAVSYQDMGTYQCLATNGIPNRKNAEIQRDSGYFNVYSSAKFSMEQYEFRSELHKPVSVAIPFYSNPVAQSDDVCWKNKMANITMVLSNNVSFSLTDTDIKRTFHGVQVTVKGQSAVMNLTSFQDYNKGNYTLMISNEKADNAEVTVLLIPSGPPDMPTDFQLLTRKISSVVLSWKIGSNGGHPQTFVILYKEKSAVAYSRKKQADKDNTRNITHEVTDLKENTEYEFLLYSYNQKGNSSHSNVLEIRTLKAPSPVPPPNSSALVGGSVGAGCAVLIVVVVIFIVFRRRKAGHGNDSKGILNNSEKSNTASRQDVDDENEGLKDNPLYVSSSGSNTVQGAGAEQINSSLYAEVVKPKKKSPPKVSDEPPPIYADVKKPKKNGKDKQKKGKNKYDGMVYENVNDMKQKETKFDGSGNDQKVTDEGKHGYTNQDGLLYVDLVFEKNPTGNKPVIHGETRTGYAMIEFQEATEAPTQDATDAPTEDVVLGAEGGKL